MSHRWSWMSHKWDSVSQMRLGELQVGLNESNGVDESSGVG